MKTTEENVPYVRLKCLIFVSNCVTVNVINPLIATLKPQSSGPSYSNTVIGTLAVDGWAVTFGTAKRRLGAAQASPGCTKITAHPSTASVPTSFYSIWHYNYLWSPKG